MRFLFVLLCLLPLTGQAKLTVLTSIEPIYRITTEIMRGVGEPDLLVRSNASAHHFAFRPSHFRLLKKADLVVWVSRDFESGFKNLDEILPGNTLSLELLSALEVTNGDGHIWYSPLLLPRVITLITQELVKLDAAHSDIYEANGKRLQQSIENWWLNAGEALSASTPKYLLDHDFLRHFESAAGLRAVTVLHNSHGQHGGIASLSAIEEKLAGQSVRCLITNETSVSNLGRDLANRFNLEIHYLKASGDQFVDRLERLSQLMLSCT